MDGHCINGKQHGEVITADDDEGRWDPEVFASYQFLPPNQHQWGYCVDCRQPFRWSVPDQRWRAWPGGLAHLPQYTDEELEVLGSALSGQTAQISAALELSIAEGMRAELGYRRVLLQSLSTSVAEARYSLWPPEGPHEPRVWGEAWAVLAAWVEEQMAGIRQSSSNSAAQGALAAFAEVRDKLGELGIKED
jgi:hypothetical protein